MKRRDFVAGVTAAGVAAAFGRPHWPQRWSGAAAGGRTVSRLDTGWKFFLGDPEGASAPGFDDTAWEAATLPHTAHVEHLVTGAAGSPTAQWQGLCWYRRTLRLAPGEAGGTVLLRFEGAMNVAQVWLDGAHVGGHLGGYLPFVLDLSDRLQPGRDHVLAVQLDNRDNPITGPKPLALLDFNMYGGLYRPVYLTRKDRLHITDAIHADRPASGGVFVTYPRVSAEMATVHVQTHVQNAHGGARTFRVRATLHAADGTVAATATSRPADLAAGHDLAVEQDLEVRSPQLWSTATPHLYVLSCEILVGDDVVDAEAVRVGIRRFTISAQGCWINGEQQFLRGTNRHQEYPYVGYALSDAAQYRDARKIKDAGFDFVRLSHYAHAPAFMDACDELGLAVMDCLPGWQYYNPDPRFVDLQYQNCRDLIRRDRNHACVALWEVSLNESPMPPEFVARAQAIAHEEYPGDQCYAAGWLPAYQVFIQSRQAGGCHRVKDHPCLVSEYGDWEYYAMNAGLHQEQWQNLTPAESNSRQLRWQGERALLQQATNFQEAHNDNRSTIAFADGLWVMYDYNRGYAPDIESSGCMDIFRLPKFSYHFFRSQRGAAEQLSAAAWGPMVFIASDWSPSSATAVRVFSNCDEVALSLNGRPLGRIGPDRDRMSTHLTHPPFTFHVATFEPGTLEAVGYVHGRISARHAVRTAEPAERLVLDLDYSGRRLDHAHKDVLFCHASLFDANGTVLADAWENVAYGTVGGGALVGRNPLATDAGISSILVQTEPSSRPVSVHALAIVPAGTEARILDAAVATDGRAPRHEVRYTTDGSEPGPASPVYRGPVAASPALRAALLVDGRVVAALSADAAKYRIPPCAPPPHRGPFRG